MPAAPGAYRIQSWVAVAALLMYCLPLASGAGVQTDCSARFLDLVLHRMRTPLAYVLLGDRSFARILSLQILECIPRRQSQQKKKALIHLLVGSCDAYSTRACADWLRSFGLVKPKMYVSIEGRRCDFKDCVLIRDTPRTSPTYSLSHPQGQRVCVYADLQKKASHDNTTRSSIPWGPLLRPCRRPQLGGRPIANTLDEAE